MFEDEPEVLEELVPMEEAGDAEYWESFSEPYHSNILEEPYIQHCIRSHQGSSIPLLILDSRLKIVYGNESFAREVKKDQPFLDTSLFKSIDPLSQKNFMIQMLQSIRSSSTGYSWQGRVSFSHVDYLTVQANALITPLFSPEDETLHSPAGYLCLFDDVTEENKNILHSTFLSLLEASKLKDNDTGNHIKRVGEYSRVICKHLFQKQIFPEIDTQFIDDITFLAPMHDVGKIGTPDEILHKNGPLTKSEWSLMKEHTINGGFILGGYPSSMAHEIPLFHHERWDGTGYPYQFSESMIPLSARIVAITDVYDALRMKRSYKEPYSHEKACEIIAKNAGSHFDPQLVDIFFEIEDRLRDIFLLLQDP